MHNKFVASKDSLKNKVIIVTGAGDGIGKQIALTYAEHGATLILMGRTKSKLEEVYDAIIEHNGAEPVIVPLDLGQSGPQQFDEIAAILESDYGKLDGLVHNASVLGTIAPFEMLDAQEVHTVMQVNVNAAFMLTQAMMPLLKKSEDASIIFTSSGVGRKGRAYWGAYAISKFATEGMMQVIADEIDNLENIRCNAINPGATRTKMRAAAFPGELPESLKTPLEIMPTYLYLMDKASHQVNGQSLDAQPK